MRTIVIGDTHGLLEELQELLEALQVLKGDRVVFLGDFVDTGPYGPAVVRFVREGALTQGWEAVLGNHEEKMLRWLKHDATRKDTGKPNPMNVPESYSDEWLKLSPEEVAWLRALPLTLDLGGNLIAAHAGFMPGVPMAKQASNDILRLRWVDIVRKKAVPMEKSPDGIQTPPGSKCWMELWDGQQGVVYGHVVHTLNVPRVDMRPGGVRSWCYGIDTGGVHGGRLTALVLKDDVSAPEIVQVDGKKAYVPFGTYGNGKSPSPA